MNAIALAMVIFIIYDANTKSSDQCKKSRNYWGWLIAILIVVEIFDRFNK